MSTFFLHDVCRHRMATDGPGVNTLVALAGCPASCRYCLNAEILKKQKVRRGTTEQLLKKVSQDACYMLATGGGVVFGGGEPLLQSEAIRDFGEKKPSWMKLLIETSLQAEEQAVRDLIAYTDLWIIDVKAEDPKIYQTYTGLSPVRMLHNLEVLIGEVPEKCLVRVPAIPGFVTEEEADRYAARLKKTGCQKIDRFTYTIRETEEDNREI